MSETETYQCPYPDCDWSRQFDSDRAFSRAAARAAARRHAKQHREEQQAHDHVCGYCGEEFRADGSCPRCRSSKKVCGC